MYKGELRQAMKSGRRALSKTERQDREACIHMHLMHRLQGCDRTSLMGYLAFDGEVNLAALLDEFEAKGGAVYLPRVRDKKSGIMDVVRMPNNWRDHIVKGAYGISEPHPLLPASGPRMPKIVLVPGVVFDRTGARIGFGGGYYDRFLTKVDSAALLIGIAFDLQLVETLLCDAHDVRVQEICTESGCQPVSDQCVTVSKEN